MQLREYSQQSKRAKIYRFIADNLFVGLLLAPFLYVILFGDLAGFGSELLPAILFQDLTEAAFISVVVFGLAWVVTEEYQKRRIRPWHSLMR